MLPAAQGDAVDPRGYWLPVDRYDDWIVWVVRVVIDQARGYVW